MGEEEALRLAMELSMMDMDRGRPDEESRICRRNLVQRLAGVIGDGDLANAETVMEYIEGMASLEGAREYMEEVLMERGEEGDMWVELDDLPRDMARLFGW